MKKIILACSFLLSVAFANAQSFDLSKLNMTYGCKDVNCKEHPDCGWQPVCHTPETLEAISKEMYNAGNDHYILVDLLKDGLLEENEMYRFDIRMTCFGENDIVPASLQQKYTDKWNAFILANAGMKKNYYHFMTIGIKPGELFEPNSKLRQPDKLSLWRNGFRQKEQAFVLQEMVNDGFINPDDEFDISFKDNIIKVNERGFPDGIKDKYNKLFKDMLGIDVATTGWSFRWGTSTKVKELIAAQ